MSFLRSIALGFAMFSRIPMPRVEWTKENMRYMICAFPFVGMVIGLLVWVWLRLSNLLALGTIIFAAGLTCIPIAATGGIHLDGFCDTVDALASNAEPEKKREILKDPHTGAFAVIFVCAYLLAYFALCTEIPREVDAVWILGIIHIMIRSTVGFGVLYYPAINSQGLFFTISSSSRRKSAAIILCLIFASCAAILTLIDGLFMGIVITMVTIICAIYIYFMSKNKFGGMSGDISGYWLQIAELAALAAFIMVRKAESI
ncbi:MAG: adenosylcobinamide-GDP ribazoletransferase [Clostridiaceae bacterium]|nr:adenosylcobinamide-GDP ribazoletransferase [Clostridiaceae bacterium]